MVDLHNNSKHKTGQKRFGAGVASLALLTAVLTACAPPETQTTEPQAEQPTTTQPQTQEPATTDTAADARDLEQLVGQTVDLRGEISDRVSDNVVNLNAEAPYDGDVLVVLPETFSLPGGEGDTVNNLLVTGEVRQFTAEEAQQLNLNIPQDQYSDYENRPMIVAEAATLSPSPNQLSENPNVFLNQPIALKGQLEELGPNTYRLSGDGVASGDILVLTSQAPAQTDEDVLITGEAQPFNLAEFQQQYNWDADLQQQIEQDYADKPVVVAEQINPVE